MFDFNFDDDCFECFACETKFAKPMGNAPEMISMMMSQLVCSKCSRCYHCCKKMHRCKFVRSN